MKVSASRRTVQVVKPWFDSWSMNECVCDLTARNAPPPSHDIEPCLSSWRISRWWWSAAGVRTYAFRKFDATMCANANHSLASDSITTSTILAFLAVVPLRRRVTFAPSLYTSLRSWISTDAHQEEGLGVGAHLRGHPSHSVTSRPHKAPRPPRTMNWSTSVVSSVSSDTEPTILVTFDNAKYVFNVGENTTRTFLQTRKGWRKTRAIFLSQICTDRSAGLPGKYLRSADILIDQYWVFRISHDDLGWWDKECNYRWT